MAQPTPALVSAAQVTALLLVPAAPATAGVVRDLVPGNLATAGVAPGLVPANQAMGGVVASLAPADPALERMLPGAAWVGRTTTRAVVLAMVNAVSGKDTAAGRRATAAGRVRGRSTPLSAADVPLTPMPGQGLDSRAAGLGPAAPTDPHERG